MLARCYRAELSKMVKGKGIYIALVVMVGIVILYAILSSVLYDSVSMAENFGTDFIDMLDRTPREEYPAMKGQLEAQLELVRGENSTLRSRFLDMEAYYLSRIAVIDYLMANESVDVGSIAVPSMGVFAMATNSLNFMLNAISLVTEIAIIYAVIVMSSILAGEMRDGTLRMQLMRPNSRRQILTAKWLATFTVSVALMLVGIVVAACYSAIHFKESIGDVLSIVANTNVSLMSSGLYIFIAFIFGLLSIFAMIEFSMFMCGISKYNRSISMAIPIVVMMVGSLSSMILQVAYLGVIDFPYCLNLMSFLTMNDNVLPHTSLYTALPVLLIYIGLFTTIGYITFDKVEL